MVLATLLAGGALLCLQAQNVEDVFSGDQPEDQNGTTPDSPKADILALQNALIERGWLAEGEADGVYGQKTKDAVAAFQAYVNEVEGAQILNVTGLADENTKDYLLDEKYVDLSDYIKNELDIEILKRTSSRSRPPSPPQPRSRSRPERRLSRSIPRKPWS